ncbi:TIGR04076 family protein [Chloroflexota bacterium]
MSEMYRVTATVTGLKGKCTRGHKVGDTVEVSVHEPGGLCGFLYHDIFPTITMLQYGGTFPWMQGDVIKQECPDRHNVLEVELRREKS